jgi:hypothetical protein
VNRCINRVHIIVSSRNHRCARCRIPFCFHGSRMARVIGAGQDNAVVNPADTRVLSNEWVDAVKRENAPRLGSATR